MEDLAFRSWFEDHALPLGMSTGALSDEDTEDQRRSFCADYIEFDLAVLAKQEVLGVSGMDEVDKALKEHPELLRELRGAELKPEDYERIVEDLFKKMGHARSGRAGNGV